MPEKRIIGHAKGLPPARPLRARKGSWGRGRHGTKAGLKSCLFMVDLARASYCRMWQNLVRATALQRPFSVPSAAGIRLLGCF